VGLKGDFFSFRFEKLQQCKRSNPNTYWETIS